MSNLSNDAQKRLLVATGSKDVGNEISSAINLAENVAAQHAQVVAGAIVATSTSTTTNFGSLKIGDVVAHIPAVAGNSIFGTVAVAGTLPFAAVVGDLYLVIRGLDLKGAKAKAATAAHF
jgi:hypothetical protein